MEAASCWKILSRTAMRLGGSGGAFMMDSRVELCGRAGFHVAGCVDGSRVSRDRASTERGIEGRDILG
jgi:hypothetical protein